jgi:DNA-directed RNA polymerase specialized sigma24 family protein
MSQPRVEYTFTETDDALIVLFQMDGIPDREAAEHLGMSISTLRERRGLLVRAAIRPPRAPSTSTGPWTDEQMKLLRSLRADKMRYRQIAKTLGRSLTAVRHKLQRLRKNVQN